MIFDKRPINHLYTLLPSLVWLIRQLYWPRYDVSDLCKNKLSNCSISLTGQDKESIKKIGNMICYLFVLFFLLRRRPQNLLLSWRKEVSHCRAMRDRRTMLFGPWPWHWESWRLIWIWKIRVLLSIDILGRTWRMICLDSWRVLIFWESRWVKFMFFNVLQIYRAFKVGSIDYFSNFFEDLNEPSPSKSTILHVTIY